MSHWKTLDRNRCFYIERLKSLNQRNRVSQKNLRFGIRDRQRNPVSGLVWRQFFLETIVRSSCLIQTCYIGFRFLRYKYYPWLTLAIAPLNLLFSSGVNRTYEKIRCMSAMTKIDVAGVCELINDLLW